MKPQAVVVGKISALTSEVLRRALLEWPQVKSRDSFVKNNLVFIWRQVSQQIGYSDAKIYSLLGRIKFAIW
jgi:hypothetical protein